MIDELKKPDEKPVTPEPVSEGHNQDHGLSLNEDETLMLEELWDERDAKRAAERAAKSQTP